MGEGGWFFPARAHSLADRSKVRRQRRLWMMLAILMAMVACLASPGMHAAVGMQQSADDDQAKPTVDAGKDDAGAAPPPAATPPQGGSLVRLKVAGVSQIVLLEHGDGIYEYVVTRENGDVLRLDPYAFTRLIHSGHVDRHWFYQLLNITRARNVLWVLLGLLGQILFTGRMLVQWLVSERKKRSVIPIAFWWMSLLGATMLLLYFIWRRDIVGVLGQGTGWVIYIRNLVLIYGKRGEG